VTTCDNSAMKFMDKGMTVHGVRLLSLPPGCPGGHIVHQILEIVRWTKSRNPRKPDGFKNFKNLFLVTCGLAINFSYDFPSVITKSLQLVLRVFII